MRSHWLLDPAITFLNHGSFGACPAPVLAAQREWLERLERRPVQFLARDLEGLLDEAKQALAAFVGAQAEDLALVPNATTAVNTVLRSLAFAPGDELLVTDHGYGACRNAVGFAAERTGARVVVAPVPFPLEEPQQVVDAVLERVTPKTRLALLDHVTSPTGLVFPIRQLVGELRERGIETLVDGAHGPGMVDVDIDAIGAGYYTGNCHKWVCAPKGAAFLHVRRDLQPGVRPLVISHGASSPRTDRSRYRIEFDWVGTDDPTAFLSIPAALAFMGMLVEGGWPALRRRNRELALRARDVLCASLGIAPPAPDAMIGALAAVPLPDRSGAPATAPLSDPLQAALLAQAGIEVPIVTWPAWPRCLVRVSAQIYNRESEYHQLADALTRALRG